MPFIFISFSPLTLLSSFHFLFLKLTPFYLNLLFIFHICGAHFLVRFRQPISLLLNLLNFFHLSLFFQWDDC